MHAAALGDEREVLELLLHFDASPLLKTFNGHTPRALAEAKGFLREVEWLEWAERDYLRRHPPRASKARNLFVDCECSYCALLRRKGGNRDDPAVAVVGAWRVPEVPGYTKRFDPKAAHLVQGADRRVRAPKKEED